MLCPDLILEPAGHRSALENCSTEAAHAKAVARALGEQRTRPERPREEQLRELRQQTLHPNLIPKPVGHGGRCSPAMRWGILDVTAGACCNLPLGFVTGEEIHGWRRQGQGWVKGR